MAARDVSERLLAGVRSVRIESSTCGNAALMQAVAAAAIAGPLTIQKTSANLAHRIIHLEALATTDTIALLGYL